MPERRRPRGLESRGGRIGTRARSPSAGAASSGAPQPRPSGRRRTTPGGPTSAPSTWLPSTPSGSLPPPRAERRQIRDHEQALGSLYRQLPRAVRTRTETKRQLWLDMLRVSGIAPHDNDAGRLFVTHSLLIAIARLVAHGLTRDREDWRAALDDGFVSWISDSHPGQEWTRPDRCLGSARYSFIHLGTGHALVPLALALVFQRWCVCAECPARQPGNRRLWLRFPPNQASLAVCTVLRRRLLVSCLSSAMQNSAPFRNTETPLIPHHGAGRIVSCVSGTAH